MRNRVVTIALVVVLVATAGWWFLAYSPKNDELAQVQTEVDGLLAQQQQLRNEITQLREVEANQVQIRTALSRLEDYIPSGPAQPSVIRHLQASADAAGAEIASVTFADPTPVVGAPPARTPDLTLAQIPVSMVIEGGYFNVVDFFRRLEVDVPRAILVNSITMAESEDGFPKLATTWTGNLFAEVPMVSAPPPPPAPGSESGGTAAPASGDTAAPASSATTASDPGQTAASGQSAPTGQAAASATTQGAQG